MKRLSLLCFMIFSLNILLSVLNISTPFYFQWLNVSLLTFLFFIFLIKKQARLFKIYFLHNFIITEIFDVILKTYYFYFCTDCCFLQVCALYCVVFLCSSLSCYKRVYAMSDSIVATSEFFKNIQNLCFSILLFHKLI